MTVLKLKSTPDVLAELNNYARTLRAIGQDLTDLHPEELEIQITGAEFVATGVGVTRPAQEQAKHDSTVQTAWNRLRSKETSHSGPTVSLQ